MLRSVLCHDINHAVREVLRDPLEDGYRAALSVVREHEVPDDDLTVLIGSQVVP